jgi:hypothetical protein
MKYRVLVPKIEQLQYAYTEGLVGQYVMVRALTLNMTLV